VLTFAPGETTKSVSVAVIGDALYEVNEKFYVNLSEPVNAVIVDGQGVATITNDDPKPSLVISDVSKAEGDLGSTGFAFTVRLSTVSGATTRAAFATTDGTATSGSDYTAKSGTVSIAAGQVTKTIVIRVTGDTLREANETFSVTLSNPTNAILSDATGLGTILDSD
jgi:hypothetical protein